MRGNDYYYLLDVQTVNGEQEHFCRYLGSKIPTKKKLDSEEKKLLKDITNNAKCIQVETTHNIIAMLQYVQDKHGYLPEQDIIRISMELSIPTVYLYGVATFYSQFKLSKPGKYIISVCTGTACHVKQSGELLTHLEQVLGIRSGETTKDGVFTLEAVNCIGACAKAPAMMVNQEVYGELDKKKVEKIVEDFRAMAKKKK